MSDIRFNQWLHQSGTGGVTQLSSGHVGIGTTSPLIPVHSGNNAVLNVGVVTANNIYAGTLNGTLALSDISGITGSFTSDVSINGNLDIADKIRHIGDTNTAIRFPAADKITLETSGTERFQVDSSGNVYVGGVGASATAGVLWFNDTSANASKISQDNGNSALVFGTGSGQAERLRIGSSGQIGLSGANYGTAGQVLTSQGSGSAVAWSTVSDTLSFRNMIINGAAMISQRLGSNTYNLTGATRYYPVDRYPTWAVGGGTITIQRSDDAPSGFQNSIMFTVNTADTDALSQSGTYYIMQQRIEGYDTRRLNMGQSNAQSSTLSFWVKSDVQGTYGVMLNNHAQNRSYLREYTVNNTDTWEYKTLTYPGDTSGTWLHESLSGVQLNWSLGSGANYQGPANQWNNSWQDHTSNQVNFMATSGKKIRFTGIQLEKGTTATTFEHRSFTDEELRCQRYFWKFVGSIYGTEYGGSLGFMHYSLPVRMRIKGTLSYSGIRTTSNFYDYSSDQILQVQIGATNPFITNPELDSES